MSAREFSKVSPAMWRSARFAGLSDKGKIAFVYFCTNAHVTSAGIYVLPDGYACSDLGWEPATYRSARAEVMGAGMLDFDPDSSVVLVERWFKHNPIANPDHSIGTRRRLQAIESDRLKEKALAAFEIADAERIEREAEKLAAKAARQAGRSIAAAEIVGNASRLMTPRIMRGGANG